MELMRFLVARSPRTLALALVFGMVSGIVNSGLLAVANAGITRGASRRGLLMAFVALCVVAPLTRAASELLLINLGQNAIFFLRTGLSRQLLSVPLRHLEEIGAHRVLSVLTDDIPNITNMVALIPVLCINTGVVLSCLVYMAVLSWKMLITVLAFMGMGILTYCLSVGRATSFFKTAREHDNNLQKHFQGLIHGLKELKLHRLRRMAFLDNVLNGTAHASRRSNISALRIFTVASSWGQMLVFVVIGLVIFFMSARFHATAGVLIGFTLALLYLMTPLQVIMNSLPGLARSNVGIGNVQQLGLSLNHSEAQDGPALSAVSDTSCVQLELLDVTYSYRQADSQEEFTLGPINLAIRKGELLFITGGNGSGKTTLAKLLAGLYEPDSGAIFYNGEAVGSATRDSYRQCFSAVFSDFFLFDSLLGLDGPELDERARAYLANLRLERKVRVDKGVLSTTELSQGQRKRLALITACLEDRPIYFFDEWAADQDPLFKRVFYHSILPELKARGKTTLVISHDDTYYDVADRIVHLDSGQIMSASPVAPDKQEETPVFRFQ